MSEQNLTLSAQKFADLKTSESGLMAEIDLAVSQAALEGIINNINRLIKNEDSFSYKQILKRCRQRAYDKRRKLPQVEHSRQLAQVPFIEIEDLKKSIEELREQLAECKPEQVSLDVLRKGQVELESALEILQEDVKYQTRIAERLCELEKQIEEQKIGEIEKDVSSDKSKTFIEQAIKNLKKLDGGKFIECFPLALLLLILTTLCSFFVVDQTTPLYTAYNFENANLMAWGAAGMAVCFSGIYGAKKGFGLGFMCFLMAAYEVLFVLSGTASHEEKINSRQLQLHPEVVLKSEELDRLKSDYEEKKALYEDPNGRNFKNAWYKKTYLDPAWETYKKAASSLIALKSEIKTNKFDKKDHLWLKLLYRLCAVILSMVLSGLAVGKLQESFTYT